MMRCCIRAIHSRPTARAGCSGKAISSNQARQTSRAIRATHSVGASIAWRSHLAVAALFSITAVATVVAVLTGNTWCAAVAASVPLSAGAASAAFSSRATRAARSTRAATATRTASTAQSTRRASRTAGTAYACQTANATRSTECAAESSFARRTWTSGCSRAPIPASKAHCSHPTSNSDPALVSRIAKRTRATWVAIATGLTVIAVGTRAASIAAFRQWRSARTAVCRNSSVAPILANTTGTIDAEFAWKTADAAAPANGRPQAWSTTIDSGECGKSARTARAADTAPTSAQITRHDLQQVVQFDVLACLQHHRVGSHRPHRACDDQAWK